MHTHLHYTECQALLNARHRTYPQMAEIEEQPKLDDKDKIERPTAEPEHRGPAESDSSNNDINDEREQVSGSETTTSTSTCKAGEPLPEPLLLDKQQAAESSDQNEADWDGGEADTTTTENEDSSGEQFEVVQLSSFGKEKPSKELGESLTMTSTHQAGGDDTGEGLLVETKETNREKEVCEEEPALQADGDDQETAAPTQTEETGADSGRTTPKEDESAGVDAEKEGEKDDSSNSQQQIQKEGEKEQAIHETGVTPTEAIGDGDDVSQEEEEGDDEMEVEASPVDAGQVDEGIDNDSAGAGSEQQQQREEEGDGGGDAAEDIPEMESTSKIDSPVQPLEIESTSEADIGESVALVSDVAAPSMEEDVQKELSETKMETEYTKDESVESIESEDTRKNDTTPEVGIPPETNMETGNETATGSFIDDVETGKVIVAQPPVVEEAGSIEAATIAKLKSEEDNSNLKSTSPPVEDKQVESPVEDKQVKSPVEEKQVESEPAMDDEGNINMAEDMPPSSSDGGNEREGRGEEEEERDDDNEQGLPLVRLGGATDKVPVEQTADKGSVRKQEECAVEEWLSAGDTKSVVAEPTVAKQDSEQHPEPVETVEADDNLEKVESDIKQPATPEIEQKGEDDTFKLELSFGSSEPETIPSKDTSISVVAADAEKGEVEKESEGAVVVNDNREKSVEDEEMEVADSSVEREAAVPDTQEESTRLREPQAADSAIVTDPSSKESSPVENVVDASEKSPTAADEEGEVMSTSPRQSKASDPKIATSSDDSFNQPLSSTEAPPTSSDAPPTSPPLSSNDAPPTSPPISSTEAPPTSSDAPPSSISPVAGTASVIASQSGTESTPISASDTSAVKEAVTCTIKTTVTVSTPPELHVDPSTVSKAPPTSSSPSESPPPTSIPTPSVAPPTTDSSSPPQAPPTDTPTSSISSSTSLAPAPPTIISSSSSEAPPKTTPTPAPTPSIAPPITSSPSFKVPSLTNVPSLSSLARSASPRVLSTTRAQAAASKKPPSTTVQSTGIVGAKLPSFDAPGDTSSVPIVTIPAASKSVSLAAEAMVSVPTTHAIAAATAQTVTANSSATAKLPSFSSIVSVPGSLGAKTAIVSGSSSNSYKSSSDTEVTSATLSSSTSSPVSVAGKAVVSTAALAVTALSNAATKPSSTVELTFPSPSITATAHHKVSQQQQLWPSSAAKPHTNTISVITQLPASFTASKTASFTSPGISSSIAAAIAGGGHHGIVLGVESLQQRDPSNIIVGMQGAERLKVGEAEILQVSTAQ